MEPWQGGGKNMESKYVNVEKRRSGQDQGSGQIKLWQNVWLERIDLGISKQIIVNDFRKLL